MGTRGELELARIQRSKQQRLGRPELVGNELEAAAGVRAQVAQRLRGARGKTDGGRRVSGSRRLRRPLKWARGGIGGDVRAVAISGGRRGKWRCWRRPGAFGILRIGEEEEGIGAELVDCSGCRQDGGGHGGGKLRRRWGTELESIIERGRRRVRRASSQRD